MGRRKKKLCKNGHDTSLEGRYTSGTCKMCAKMHSVSWTKTHPEIGKIWREKNPQKIRNYSREQAWKDYGIKNEDGSKFTVVDYDRLYQIQQGKCALCRKHSTEFKRTLALDHDHKTGHIRGLLCVNCNIKLGIVEQQEFDEFYKNVRDYLGPYKLKKNVHK